jgi:peptide/nickel transport system substrate-binding protein
MEALRDAWFDAPDLAAQQAICARMQALAFEEVPFIPLGQRFSPTAMRNDIVDVVPAPYPIFWNVRRS